MFSLLCDCALSTNFSHLCLVTVYVRPALTFVFVSGLCCYLVFLALVFVLFGHLCVCFRPSGVSSACDVGLFLYCVGSGLGSFAFELSGFFWTVWLLFWVHLLQTRKHNRQLVVSLDEKTSSN